MVVEIKSVSNFLDLGGLQTNDGKQLKPNRLYRSQILSNLSINERIRITNLNFGLVCDLRSIGERENKPNCCFDRNRTKIIEAGFDAKLNAVRVTDWGKKLKNPTFDIEQANETMLNAYKAMPTSLLDLLSEIFVYLDQPVISPILVHCSAGKDRTGFIIAMLLWALDVPYDVILKNYIMSGENFYNSGLNQSMLKRIYPEYPPQRAIAANTVISSVNPLFLSTLFTEITNKYGSIDNYLTTGAGLTQSRKANIKRKLLINNE